MSVDENVKLLDEAAELIDYFDGTMIGRVLESVVDSGDMESLSYQVGQARKVLFDLEYNPGAV